MKNNFAILLLNFFLLLNLTLADLNFGSSGPAKHIALTGNAINDNFGYTVASGDINKDGYDDMIIGAYKKENDRGMVYVIYGGMQTNLIDRNFAMTGQDLDPLSTGFIIKGNAANDWFGSSLSTGDINNDGYDDIIIGAHKKNSDQGAVYVVYGRDKSLWSNIDLASMPLVPSTTGFKITGDTFGDYFGFSVSTGDVNNDQFDDVIIGAYDKNSGQGQVYVIYGDDESEMKDINLSNSGSLVSPTGGPTGFIIKTDQTTVDSFGRSVCTGDVNGDDFDDIIIGAPEKDNKRGFVYVIFGGAKSLISSPVISKAQEFTLKDLKLKGASTGSYFGHSVGSADVNGDGIDDLIIGAYGANTVYIVYGKRTFTENFELENTLLDPTSIGFMIKGEGSGSSISRFGIAVSGAGDINKDGFEDILIGADYKNSNHGAAYIVYGGGQTDVVFSTPVDSNKAVSVLGNAASKFGTSVCSGDFNNDGFSDVIVGAPDETSSKGAAYVLFYNVCPENCETCNSTSVCDVCSASYFLDKTLGKCVQNCPDATYGKDRVCEECPKNCDTCVSPGFCMICSTSYFLENVGRTCVPNCPATTYGENGVCQACGTHCDYCESSTICTNCTTSYFLDKIQKNCGLICPIKTVPLNGVCENCPDDCDFCESDTICKTCSTNFFLYKEKCLRPCPSRTFISGNTCKDCETGCESCSETSCDVCFSPFLLYQGQCLRSCPDGTFPSGGVCENCSDNCKSCSSLTLCNECSEPYFLNEGECGPSCPTTKFEESSNRVCEDCPHHCDTCSDSKTCQVCTSLYLLYQEECVGNCPIKTFTLGDACYDCLEECSECINESTCQKCVDGYTLTESHLCVKQTKEIEEKDDEKAAAGVFEGTSLVGASLSSGSSLPLNFGLVAKILRNFKYMDIPVSRELQETFVSWKVASGFMSAPKSWSKKYTSKELPSVFSRYGLQSAFLINFWKPFSMALVGAALFGIFKVIEMYMSKKDNKKSTIYSISRQVNVAASNFALTQFYSNLDDVIFYFIIEARSMEFDTGFRVFSLIFAVIILMAGSLLVTLHMKFVGKYQNLKGEKINPQLEAFVAKCENANLIFKDFKDTTPFIQSFLLINVIRSVISSFIFAVFFGQPVLQIFMLFILNIIMLTYLWVKKPFKDFVSSCGQIFCEVILLIANICVFILVIFDQSDSFPIDDVERLSKCIIVLNFILLIGCAILMLVNIGKMLYESYQEKKRGKVMELRTDSSEIFTSAKFSRPAQSDQNLGHLTTTTDLINESQNKPDSYRNVLETSCGLRNNNSQPDLGTSHRNYYFPNQRNMNMESNNEMSMSSSNIVFQPNHNDTNLFSNSFGPVSQQIRRHPRQKRRMTQDLRREENSIYESPESRIQDPSFHSRMVLNQEMTMDQDVSLTNYEGVSETSPPLASQKFIPRRKIRKNEDMVLRGIGK